MVDESDDFDDSSELCVGWKNDEREYVWDMATSTLAHLPRNTSKSEDSSLNTSSYSKVAVC